MNTYYLARYTVSWSEENVILNGMINRSNREEIKFEATDDDLAKKIADEKRIDLYNKYYNPPVTQLSEVKGVSLDALMYVKDLIKETPKTVMGGNSRPPNLDSEYYADNDPKVIWGA